MKSRCLLKLLLVLGCAVFSTLSHAVGGITSDGAGPHYSRFSFEETFEDMWVKVLGGHVRMTRNWTGRTWQWNNRWQDLEFHEGNDAVADLTAEPLFIRKSGQAFRRVPNSTPTVYENQLRTFITKTENGYQWRDSRGNSIDYDALGRIISYADRNNVKVFIDRDVNGYITQIRDHHGNTAIDYTWQAIPGSEPLENADGQSYTPQRLHRLTDYSGRTVTYQWNSANQLTGITDVLGSGWQLVYSDSGALTRIIDPDGFITRYNIGLNGQFNSRIDGDGVGVSYRYSYDEEEETYHITEIDTAGRVIEKTYNAMGHVERQDNNGNTQSARSLVMSDGSQGVKNLVRGYSTTRKLWYRGSELVSIEEYTATRGSLVTTPIYIKTETLTDARGNKTVYEYDQWKNILKQTHPDGSHISYTWNTEFSLPLTYTNEKGVVTQYEYDERGNLITLIEAKGTADERATRHTYDQYGQRLSTTTGESAAGNTALATTQFEYDVYGNVVQVTDPLGNVTRFVDHDALGNAHAIIDPLASALAEADQYSWTQTYDAAGNLLQEHNPYSQGSSFSYTPGGRLASSTAQNGAQTTYTTNHRGLTLTSTDAQDAVTKLEYDNAHRRIASIDPNGHSTRRTYNSAGQLSKVVDGEGHTIKYNYVDNLLRSVEYPTFKEEYQYDNRNRVVQTVQQANNRSYLRKMGYDIVDNLSSNTDANSSSNNYQYDNLGRLIQSADAAGGHTRFRYDARDNLVQVEDPEGRLTLYTYNLVDQQLSETKHDYLGTTHQRIYQYDANGNLTTKVNPQQEKTLFEYDRAGRLMKTAVYAHKDDAFPVKMVNFMINAGGQLSGYSQVVGANEEGAPNPQATPDIQPFSETYTYTTLGQIDTVTVNFGAFQKTYSYSYYPNGLKHTYTNPEGITYTYYYNKNNQLTAVHIPGNGQLSYSNFKWLAPQLIVLPGGNTISLSYDDFLQVEERILKDPANNNIAQALYQYDLEHNIKKIEAGYGSYLFNYDSLYRLTGAVYPSGAAANDELFDYDGVGNRISHALTEQGDVSATESMIYNNQNQLIQTESGVSFTYNANGHTETKTADGQTIEYIYNHEERLTAVKQNDVTVGEYAYNPYGQRIRKIANGQATYYLYNDEGLAAEYSANGTMIKEYHFKPYSTWMTEPLFQRTSAGDVYYYQNDHLGTPQRMVAANGAVVWKATYSAFGKANIIVDAVTNNLRFPGQYFDSETGLHYNYHRTYDASVGRYLESDPIGLDGGANTYGYALQNPIRFIDPLGLITETGCSFWQKFVGLCKSFPDTPEGFEDWLDNEVDKIKGKACGAGFCDDKLRKCRSSYAISRGGRVLTTEFQPCEALKKECDKLVEKCKERVSCELNGNGNGYS